MYVRIKRELLTLFFTVDASTTLDEIKDRLFDSLAFEVDHESETPGERPVVGTVVCETDARISSAGDITLALCRRLPDDDKNDRNDRNAADVTAEGGREPETDVRVETRILAGSSSIADSKVENDDVICIVLPGEDVETVFKRILASVE